MIVTVRHRDGGEGLAPIVRFVETGVEHINGVSIFGIGIDARVVPGALSQIALLVSLRPRLATIIRAKHAAVFCFDNCPYSIGIRRRNSDADDANRALRQTLVASYFGPGIAAVC